MTVLPVLGNPLETLEGHRRSEHHWTMASQIRHGENFPDLEFLSRKQDLEGQRGGERGGIPAFGAGFDGEDIEAAECFQYLIKSDHRTIVRHNAQTMMKCDRNMVNTQNLGSTSIDKDVHGPSIWGKKATCDCCSPTLVYQSNNLIF